MQRLRILTYALGLVASPLLVLGYWLLYPAYGDVHATDVFADISADPGRTHVADVVMLAGCLLAVAGALAYLQLLADRAPRLVRVGVAFTVIGWTAVASLLLLDVLAAQAATTPRVFNAVYGDPFVLVLDALAALHIVGGVLIGVALLRTRLVPRALAAAGTAAPVVHVVSNVSGLLWADATTWVVVAAMGAVVLRRCTDAARTEPSARLDGLLVSPV